jgi:sugar phosphate isomerase/epimerase
MGSLDRRTLLGAAAMTLAPAALRARPDEGDPAYAGFKMGVQTYSLRAFDLDGCIARVKELGLKYTQFFAGKQMKITDDAAELAGYKKKLADAGLTMLSFGVVRFSADHAANKRLFDFAKAMALPVLVCDFKPDDAPAVKSVVELTKETGLKVAVHNHGPGHHYDKLADVQKLLDKTPEAVGACADLGHFIRSGEDAGKLLRALGGRVHDVHLKDARDANTFTILGEGRMNVADVFKALKEIKFAGCLALEYELSEQDPMADMKRCLEAARAAAKGV